MTIPKLLVVILLALILSPLASAQVAAEKALQQTVEAFQEMLQSRNNRWRDNLGSVLVEESRDELTRRIQAIPTENGWT